MRGAPDWEFVILEACYANVREALAERVSWLPSFLLWPMVASAEWLLDVDVDDLDAERAIARLQAPTLLAQGDADTKVGPNAKERLFAASGAIRKARCDVPKAGHVDLWSAGGRVQAAIIAFLHPR
jgi:pimeloyl-ACP methyl ester carboxylesterase